MIVVTVKRASTQIHLPKLELKRSKSWYLVGLFLDLRIAIKNKKFVQSCLIRKTAFHFQF